MKSGAPEKIRMYKEKGATRNKEALKNKELKRGSPEELPAAKLENRSNLEKKN